MNHNISVLALTLCGFFCGCAVAKHGPVPAFTPAQKQFMTTEDAVVTQAINRYIRRDHVPGVAVALYYQGKPHFYNFGVADKNTRTPVTEKTLFELGSVTKVFTGILLADQVQKGRMHLNDSVAQHLSAPSLQHVTLQNLATHTGGLPSLPPGLSYRSSRFWHYNTPQLWSYLNHWRPVAAVGRQYVYSNLGFSVLGYAEARAANMSYEQLLQQTILWPLQMSDTQLIIAPRKIPLKAQGYFLSDREGPAPDWPNNAFAAASVLHSNTKDMMRFLQAALGDNATPTTLKQAMVISQRPYYPFPKNHGGYQSYMGLGWQLSNFQSNTMIDKTGDTFGFGSYIALIPAQKIGIVILANKPTRMCGKRSRPTIDAAKAIFKELMT